MRDRRVFTKRTHALSCLVRPSQPRFWDMFCVNLSSFGKICEPLLSSRVRQAVGLRGFPPSVSPPRAQNVTSNSCPPPSSPPAALPSQHPQRHEKKATENHCRKGHLHAVQRRANALPNRPKLGKKIQQNNDQACKLKMSKTIVNPARRGSRCSVSSIWRVPVVQKITCV